MMARRKLIFDTDGGVDDAQALLMLIASGRAPDLITTVFGNVSLAQATENQLCVTAIAGVDIPVHAGADRPMVQPIIDATAVHGNDGLGGATRPSHDKIAAPHDAISVLRNTFREAAASGERVDIIMIGPLTNLAMALQLEPRIVDGIGTLTIMGGNVYGRGNTTPAAEFNIYADPEGAHVVLTAGIETVIAPWEACLAHTLSGADIDAMNARLPPSPVRAFLSALSDQQRMRIRGYGRPDMIYFVDPLAAALVIEPSIVTTSIVASTSVALAPGITRGMTLVDPSGRLGTPKVTFVERVDQAALDRLYEATIAYVPN
jgi:purine nucleosidase